MAKARKKASRKFVPFYDRPVLPGVGFDPRAKGGSAVVVMQLPLDGIHIYGPFKTMEDAHSWVNHHSASEAWNWSNPADIRFYVRWLDVPRKEVE